MMTPSTLTLHRAALSSGDRAVWGRIIRVDRKGVAQVVKPPARSLAQPVSLKEPLPERKPA